MKENTGDAYTMRSVICTVYSAIGRASESATMAWDNMSFNTSLEAPEAEWMELKTGKSALMSFFVDALSYKMCVIHSLFCYIVADGANMSYDIASSMNLDSLGFVYPAFINKGEGYVARTITAKLKSVAKKGLVPGLTSQHTSQGLKHRAADDCSHSKCNIVSTVARAGWDYSGQVSKIRDCIIFLY